MLSQHATSIERLLRAAARAHVQLPAGVGELSPTQLLVEAVASHRRPPEGTPWAELLSALDQVARRGGFDDDSAGYLKSVVYPQTPLEVLKGLGPGHRDLALALARAYRLFGGSPRNRHELFERIAPHMDALDALDVVAHDADSNRPSLVGSLTADDAAVILPAVPADARFALRYGLVFSPADTAAMLRFGGRAGAVLAVRAGSLDAHTVHHLPAGRTAAELLEVLSVYDSAHLWDVLALRGEEDVTAAVLAATPTGSLARSVLSRLPLSRPALVELLVRNPGLVQSWASGSGQVNAFSTPVLVAWARRTSASAVRVADLPRQVQREAALYLRGVAPKVKHLLDGDSDPSELRVLLEIACEVFGGEPRLWTRLATAEANSPFGDRTLGLIEATDRYWERWNAAAARSATRS